MAAYLDGAPVTPYVSGVIDAAFGPFLAHLDSYCEAESKSLKSAFEELVLDVTFEQLQGSDHGDFADPDIEPIQAFDSFGERLLAAADCSYAPIEAALLRSGTYLNGLKVKALFRAIATTVTAFIKQMMNKIDELRVGLGLQNTANSDVNETSSVGAESSSASSQGPPTQSGSKDKEKDKEKDKRVSSSVGSVGVVGASTLAAALDVDSAGVATTITTTTTSSSGFVDSPVNYSAARHWGRKLQEAGSELSTVSGSGRMLVPCVLRAMQAVGRLCRRLGELDIVACSQVGVHL